MSRVRARHLPVLAALLLALFGLTADVGAQVNVRGKVLNDMNGQPLEGANVRLKGAASGAITNKAGDFLLSVPDAHATLVVSYIGYTDGEVALAGRTTNIEIRLSMKAIVLDQIVAVGYGTQRRSDVTGSVASVSADRLEAKPAANIAEALAGAVPGLSVTSSQASAEGTFAMVIRGQNSITASNTPLVVVDGIPYGGNISELNPAEIQSLDILKDASAAAIYGARGSNGVILITTRSGSGQARIAYSGRIGTATAVNIPEMMTAAQFGPFKCQHMNNGVGCDDAQLEQMLTASELANYRAGRSTDWVDLATQNGVMQQHSISFSGGTDATRYYISLGMLDNEGVAVNDQYSRYNLRLNLEQTMNSWLKIGSNTQLSLIDRSGLEASFSGAFVQNPLNSAYNEDGTQTVYPWPEDVYFANPLQGLLAVDDDDSRRIFTSNHVDVTLPFIPGLSYRLNAGVDYEDRQHGRYYGRDTRNGYSSLGQASTDDIGRFDWTLENVVRYQRDFGDHSLDLTALYSQEGNRYENYQLNSEGFPNDVLTYYQANVGQVVTPAYSYSESGLESQMLRVNYTFGDRFLATTTVRRDGFSGFGADHKYGTFPSFALGWNLAREGFWPLKEQVQAFKLRLSWGENGNEAIRPYQTLARLGQLSYLDGTTTAPGYIPVSLANPDLRWETSSQVDAGLDYSIHHDRVQGSIDFYWSRTHDLLLNRSISPTHGITSVLQNIGKTANRGFELSVTTRNLESSRLSWSTNFNIAANRNEIRDLYGDGQDDIGNGWFIGRPIDVNFGYEFDGIWQQADDIAGSAQPTAKPGDVRIKDQNGDLKIDAADRVILGRREPKYMAGLTNTVKYGRLTLAVFINTVQGIERPNPLLSPNVVGPQVRYNTIVQDYWTPENPITTYPANREGVNPLSVGFYQNSSFIRLQDVNLGYELPRSLSDRFGFQSLRLFVDGKNLWTSTEWTGLDPEFGSSNQRDVPQSRTIIFGLDASF